MVGFASCKPADALVFPFVTDQSIVVQIQHSVDPKYMCIMCDRTFELDDL